MNRHKDSEVEFGLFRCRGRALSILLKDTATTQDERRKLYATLAVPFPENAIQRTEGRITGRGYDTAGIGYQFICNRLNEVVGVDGWRTHKTVTVKEITTAKGRPAYEAICDLTREARHQRLASQSSAAVSWSKSMRSARPRTWRSVTINQEQTPLPVGVGG